METNRLKQFCTIVEVGSMTRASELLGITHSGLSKSISLLEEELKLKLFQPSGRGIAVTEAGEKIYRRSQKVLQSIEELHQKDNSTETSLRFGVLEIFTSYFMGKMADEVFPKQPIEILELGPGEIENALAEERISIGLTDLPVPRPEVEHLSICSVQSGIYAIRDKFKNFNLADITFVAPSVGVPSNPLGISERDGWPDGLFPRKKVFRVNLLSTALDLTRSGVCAIYIPNFVADLHNDSTQSKFNLTKLNLPHDFPQSNRELYLVKRKNSLEGKNEKKVAAFIRKICK